MRYLLLAASLFVASCTRPAQPLTQVSVCCQGGWIDTPQEAWGEEERTCAQRLGTARHSTPGCQAAEAWVSTVDTEDFPKLCWPAGQTPEQRAEAAQAIAKQADSKQALKILVSPYCQSEGRELLLRQFADPTRWKSLCQGSEDECLRTLAMSEGSAGVAEVVKNNAESLLETIAKTQRSFGGEEAFLIRLLPQLAPGLSTTEVREFQTYARGQKAQPPEALRLLLAHAKDARALAAFGALTVRCCDGYPTTALRWALAELGFKNPRPEATEVPVLACQDAWAAEELDAQVSSPSPRLPAVILRCPLLLREARYEARATLNLGLGTALFSQDAELLKKLFKRRRPGDISIGTWLRDPGIPPEALLWAAKNAQELNPLEVKKVLTSLANEGSELLSGAAAASLALMGELSIPKRGAVFCVKRDREVAQARKAEGYYEARVTGILCAAHLLDPTARGRLEKIAGLKFPTQTELSGPQNPD